MTDTDSDLRDRLVAMESRLETAEPPALSARRNRRFAISFAVAPLLALAVAATAAAGIVVANQAHGYPGVENPGQPLAGAKMECMTPPQAAAYISAHGISKVMWQVERDAPTQPGADKPGSTSVQQSTVPETGMVVPGAIIDGTLVMLVDQRQGAQMSGACSAR
jgi:hypothetical protein